MKQVAIVGFGRFGQLLARTFRDSFDIRIVERDAELKKRARRGGYRVVPFKSLGEADTIILAVPISALAAVLKQLAPIAHEKQTVIDVCSVKVYPARLLEQYVPQCQTLATHPLFGPDSARDGLEGHQLVICPVHADEGTIKLWTDFWEKQGARVARATPEVHDYNMMYSLGLTQTLARLIGRVQVPDLVLTTKSFDAVKRVTDFSLNDTDQLYHDMLYYNPYFRELKERWQAASAETIKQLDHIAKEQEEALNVARKQA